MYKQRLLTAIHSTSFIKISSQVEKDAVTNRGDATHNQGVF